MSRPLRIAYPGAWYHIMNRGLARKDIFLNNKHREMFLELLIEIHHSYNIEIHAYCLMNNHYHLLIRTPLGNISRAMRHLDGVYTQRFNRSMNCDGPIFRGRYKSILVEADTYLLRLSRYIHLNPVKAGLVQQADRFRWSSYRFYLSGKHLHWLTTNMVLSYFGKHLTRTRYKNFIDEGVDAEIDSFYKKIKTLPILGSAAFSKTISDAYLEERHRINEIPEHKLLNMSTRNSIDRIMESVASFYNVKKENLMQVNKRAGNLPRAVGMYMSQLIGQFTSSDIAKAFTMIGTEGVLKSCRQIKSKIKHDKVLENDINELRCLLVQIKLEVGT